MNGNNIFQQWDTSMHEVRFNGSLQQTSVFVKNAVFHRFVNVGQGKTIRGGYLLFNLG
jgi:hypothetical protein